MNEPVGVVEVEVPREAGHVTAFGGCSLIRLPSFSDHRGVLTVAERHLGLAFDAVRFFMLFGVPEGERRGGHSLAVSEEVMVAAAGSVTLEVDDGRTCWRVVLDDPTLAVHVPVGVWSEQHSFTEGAVLLVLASAPFDPDEFDNGRPGRVGDD